MLSLAQVFRIDGHEVLIASGGQPAQKAAEVGLVMFDVTPGLDSEAGYRHHEVQRKKSNIRTQMNNFSSLSREMTDHLVELAGHWRPDPIIYPPLGVIRPLVTTKYDMSVVMQTAGFGHTPRHIKGVTRSLTGAYCRHNVGAISRDMAQIDITLPSTSILKNGGEPITPIRYVPYNGGAVWEPWWKRRPRRKRLLVNLGTIRPTVDGLDLITWVMDSASEVDVEIILHVSANMRPDLRSLPSNVCLAGWIPMDVFLNGADGFIHHGGAGNALIALHAGIPQTISGQGADRPVNARVVAECGCGIIPGDVGLPSNMIDTFLNNHPLRKASEGVAAKMAAQPCPGEMAKSLITMVQRG